MFIQLHNQQNTLTQKTSGIMLGGDLEPKPKIMLNNSDCSVSVMDSEKAANNSKNVKLNSHFAKTRYSTFYLF